MNAVCPGCGNTVAVYKSGRLYAHVKIGHGQCPQRWLEPDERAEHKHAESKRTQPVLSVKATPICVICPGCFHVRTLTRRGLLRRHKGIGPAGRCAWSERRPDPTDAEAIAAQQKARARIDEATRCRLESVPPPKGARRAALIQACNGVDFTMRRAVVSRVEATPEQLHARFIADAAIDMLRVMSQPPPVVHRPRARERVSDCASHMHIRTWIRACYNNEQRYRLYMLALGARP